MLRLIAAAVVWSLATAPASAKTCRDAKGHFTKCADKAPAKPKQCRDAKGHFKKC